MSLLLLTKIPEIIEKDIVTYQVLREPNDFELSQSESVIPFYFIPFQNFKITMDESYTRLDLPVIIQNPLFNENTMLIAQSYPYCLDLNTFHSYEKKDSAKKLLKLLNQFYPDYYVIAEMIIPKNATVYQGIDDTLLEPAYASNKIYCNDLLALNENQIFF